MKEKSRLLEERLATKPNGTRVMTLTDSVFGIVMTLLVFSFVVPGDLPSENAHELFLSLGPQFLAYILSFTVLGALWIGHHNITSLMKHFDRKAMWVNIIFLAFIALVPFTTSILRAFYGTQISVIAYGMNLVICGIALYWLWAHAVDEKLLEEGIDEQMADAMKYRILIPVAIALLTTMIALVSPFTSIILFALLFLLVTVPTSNDVIVSLFQKK